jgi:hypothetical protein
VDGYPRQGELLLVPTEMAGCKMTLDDLAAQATQFIIEVLVVRENLITMQFRGAIKENIRSGQDLPHGEEFVMDFERFGDIDYFVIRRNLPASWFGTVVDRAMEAEKLRQATGRAASQGVDPTTPSATSTFTGPAVTSSGTDTSTPHLGGPLGGEVVEEDNGSGASTD